MTNISVVKRDGSRESYDANKINLAIEKAAEGLDDSIAWVTQIASELELTLFGNHDTAAGRSRHPGRTAERQR